MSPEAVPGGASTPKTPRLLLFPGEVWQAGSDHANTDSSSAQNNLFTSLTKYYVSKTETEVLGGSQVLLLGPCQEASAQGFPSLAWKR